MTTDLLEKPSGLIESQRAVGDGLPADLLAERVKTGTMLDELPRLKTLWGEDRLAALGVDLSQYQNLLHREPAREIVSRTYRGLMGPLAKTLVARSLRQVPAPMMLTHIVTTQCNYLCSFCSFADTLNTKTNQLSLEEIERVYTTIGDNLNTVVYSGGETTLNKDLPAIIEAAYQRTPVKSAYIISNAWKPDLLFAITHRIMQRCPDLHLTWSLSIEGPREHNNIERRTHSPAWDAWQNTVDTLEGLKLMREQFGYKQLNIQLCTVCSPANAHLMDDWYEMVRDVLQPDKWNLNLMRRSVQMSEHSLPGFIERRQHQGLEPFEQKYLEITRRVKADVLSGRLKFKYTTRNPVEGTMKSAVDLVSQEANRRTVLEQDQQFCCLAGYTGAYISSDGKVSGCEEFAHNPRDEKSYGNLRDVEYDFMALWHGSTANKLRGWSGNARECRGCTLESQRNYPSILVSAQSLGVTAVLASQIKR